MAGTTIKTHGQVGGVESTLRQLVIQLNAVVVDIETLRAAVDAIADKLDADAGVTDVNYATTAAVATAATMTAAKIGDASGTAITA